jgi:hypothetical protein
LDDWGLLLVLDGFVTTRWPGIECFVQRNSALFHLSNLNIIINPYRARHQKPESAPYRVRKTFGTAQAGTEILLRVDVGSHRLQA